MFNTKTYNKVKLTMTMKATVIFFLTVSTSATAEFKGRDVDVYVAMFSGFFSNARSLTELGEDGIVTAQSVLEMYIYPFNYPPLHSDYVLFFNELKDGNVSRQQFLALNQSGPIMHMENINIAKSKIFNKPLVDVSELESFNVDDLRTAPFCQSYIERIGETLFTAEYPNCDNDGYTTVTYKAIHSCDTFTVYIDSNKFPEPKSKLPYKMMKEESYPVSSIPDYDRYKAMCNY